MGTITKKNKLDIDEVIRDLQFMFKPVPAKLPKEVVHLDDKQMEFLYTHAYGLFQGGKFKEAIPIFRLLHSLDPAGFRYIFALAACHHHIKDYDIAILYYFNAAKIERKNSSIFYYLYDCFAHQNKMDEAEDVLREAIATAEGQPKFNNIKQRAVLELSRLEKNKKKA